MVKVFLHCLLSVIRQQTEAKKIHARRTQAKKKKTLTLENIISTNRPAADGNDLCLPVESSSAILLTALLLSLLQQAEHSYLQGLCARGGPV